MNDIPLVSIVIPCRNEEKFIVKCLDSIINNDYPKDQLEVLIIDGMSEDKTRDIIKEYTQQHPFIRLLDNPKRIAPSALNIGIENAKGEIIMRMDAHVTYEKDYISKCVSYMEKYKVDNVGGACITISGNNTLVSKAIALVLSSPFGVGNSYFRIGVNKPKEVDTVPFGCYRRELFNRIGLFNERLIRTEDIEFNARIRKDGGKIMIFPDIISYYYARPSLSKLFKQYLSTGTWKIYLIKMLPGGLSLRHFVPLVFTLSLIGSSIMSLFLNYAWITLVLISVSYLFTSLVFSAKIAFSKGIRYLPVLPVVFICLHFSYSLGMIRGILTNRRFSKDAKINKNLARIKVDKKY